MASHFSGIVPGYHNLFVPVRSRCWFNPLHFYDYFSSALLSFFFFIVKKPNVQNMQQISELMTLS